MTALADLKARWVQDPAFRAEYEALEWRGNRLVPAPKPREPHQGHSQSAPEGSGRA